MGKKRCCVAILGSREQIEAARRVVAQQQNVIVSMSWFFKPGTLAEGEWSIECSNIGAISVEGSLAEGLARRHIESSSEFGKFSDLLYGIGIPESHHRAYEKTLNEGRVLMILQGTENRIRIGCNALSEMSLEKPILYFE